MFLLCLFFVSAVRWLVALHPENVMTDHKQDDELVEAVEQDTEDEARSSKSGVLDIRKYTKQIWLAGLCAFSKAEEEGGRFFEALVDTGRNLETKTRSAEAKVDDIRERVRHRTGETMGKMEKAFDERLNKALSRLGLPNKREVEDLKQRIQELTAEHESKDGKQSDE